MVDLPEMNHRIHKLKRDHRGFPVPWFVQWFKEVRKNPDGTPQREPCDYGVGEPDFRVMDSQKLGLAIRNDLCWVCGEKLGTFNKAFTIGPMCAINRTISEPPSHFSCAMFSVRACPFLMRPRMRRNEKDIPEQGMPAPGFHLDRNPGVICIWVTKSYRVFRAYAGDPGLLLRIGDPLQVHWFAEGQPATRAQVEASIESGYPSLLQMAQRDGDSAIAALAKMKAQAMALLPSEVLQD